VGIPPHRLPSELLDWEIQQVVDEGVELRLGEHVDDIPGLLDKGYKAVLIATGAHVAKKLPIRNSNHPDNWMSLDVLRRVALGERLNLSGKRVVVLGGGNVALDVSRAVVRLGAREVRMACLEPRGEMPGFRWEIGVAEAEGVQMFPGRTFKEVVVKGDKITGVRCVQIEFRGFKRGRPDITEIAGAEHELPADVVIWAIGQGPDFSFLPQDGSINTRFPVGIQTDEEMMTTARGVFCAGDVRRGMTFFVVDAIAEGHRVARCIDRYLRGKDGVQEPKRLPVVELAPEEIEVKFLHKEATRHTRIPISSIPLEQRKDNFREVDLCLTEEEAQAETNRCLRCGICSECLECVVACERGAIDHEMQPETVELEVGTMILATGFTDFDPGRAPELGYGRVPNVVTALEIERMLNPSGPTAGKILKADGEPPKRVAVLHCVGSRDDRFHEYCSRVCCMYSLKLSQLLMDYAEAEVHEVYRDLRCFGKGYEEFYNRTRQMGVHFYHGKVNAIESANGDVKGPLVVRWQERFHNQPDHVEVDMVVLATGFEPRADTPQVASMFGVSRSRSGFFLERHPKLAPVETASQGIYLAGACQSPMDIPDSVAYAGGAAAAALSLIDQGTIALEPSIAQVQLAQCKGCGQCVAACPYGAVVVAEGHAAVNEYLCKGCGTCAAACPNKAMSLIHFDDRQIIDEMVGALEPPVLITEVG